MKSNEYQGNVLKHFNERVNFWTQIYSEKRNFNAYMLQERTEYILSLCEKLAHKESVLDLGCGAGHLVHQLCSKGYRAEGVDLSPSMVATAKAESKKLGLASRFQIASADALPYADASFGVLTALGVIEYVADQNRSLAEIYRVLKPGGYCLITMPNALSLYLWVAFPRSIPLLLGPDFKIIIRKIENKVRSLVGLKLNNLSNMWLGQSVLPWVFVRKLTQCGFKEVKALPRLYGPLHPFGFHFWSEGTDIRWSRKIELFFHSHPILKWSGALVVYQGRKP